MFVMLNLTVDSVSGCLFLFGFFFIFNFYLNAHLYSSLHKAQPIISIMATTNLKGELQSNTVMLQ